MSRKGTQISDTLNREGVERVVTDHVDACKRANTPLTNVAVAFVQAVYR